MNVIITNKNESVLMSLGIDVIKTLNGVFTVDDLAATFKNFYYNKMILDITAIEDYENINTIQNLSVAFDMSKVIILLDDSNVVSSPMYLSSLVSMGIYNFTKNADAIPFLIDNPNTYKDVANYQDLNMRMEEPKLNDNNLDINVNSFELNKYLSNLNNNETEVILIDMNNADVESYFTDVLYLIEPGLIQLNKLIKLDRTAFNKLKGKKIILNRSVLSQSDVADFEKESGSKVFYNMPNVDDKIDDNVVIKKLLKELGFTRIDDHDSKGFSLFR